MTTDCRGRHVPDRPNAPIDEAAPHHHGGSFRRYMESKIQKLQEQYREDKSALQAAEGSNTLFRGICIFVNGYTQPTQLVGLDAALLLACFRVQGNAGLDWPLGAGVEGDYGGIWGAL